MELVISISVAMTIALICFKEWNPVNSGVSYINSHLLPPYVSYRSTGEVPKVSVRFILCDRVLSCHHQSLLSRVVGMTRINLILSLLVLKRLTLNGTGGVWSSAWYVFVWLSGGPLLVLIVNRERIACGVDFSSSTEVRFIFKPVGSSMLFLSIQGIGLYFFPSVSLFQAPR